MYTAPGHWSESHRGRFRAPVDTAEQDIMKISESLVELTVRFSGAVPPFRFETLITGLPKIGFVVVNPPDPDFYTRILASGVIASRGVLRVVADGRGNSLGIRGTEFEPVQQAFEELEGLLDQELDFSVAKGAEYYQLQAQAIFRSRKQSNPLAVFQRREISSPILDKLTSIIGKPVANFGYRLVSVGTPAQSLNWIDIQLEPEVLQPDRQYYFRIIFRNTDQNEVLSMVKKGFSFADQLVEAIGG